MKFCQNCGTSLEDDALFCLSCGVKQEMNYAAQENTASGATAYQPEYTQVNPTQANYTQPDYTQPVYNQPVNNQPVYNQPVYNQPGYYQPMTPPPAKESFFKKHFKVINIVSILLSVAMVLTTAFFVFGLPLIRKLKFNKYVEAYVDAEYGGKFAAYAKYIPNAAYDSYDVDKGDLIDRAEDNWDPDDLEEEYGDDFRYSCKVKGVIHCTKDGLKDFKEELSEDLDISKSKITDAVQVAYVVNISGDKNITKCDTVILYKLNGKWYIYDTYPLFKYADKDYDDYDY